MIRIHTTIRTAKLAAKATNTGKYYNTASVTVCAKCLIYIGLARF